jgi:catechol 2,3-dioxygenase-like lactoylglutathione lyase family enzyme
MSHPDMVPLLITDELAATRRFYLDDLGCTPVIEQDGYLQIRFGDDPDTRELAFMTPDPPDGPMGGQPAYAGGLILSVAVADADKQHALLAERGVDVSEASDKPWGWRSFVVRDPNGVTLDFFHEIADTASQDATG